MHEFEVYLSVYLTNGRLGECLGNLFENNHFFAIGEVAQN